MSLHEQIDAVQVGAGRYRYAAVVDWCRLPDDRELGEVTSVATDRQDRVFVFARARDPVMVFDAGGEFQYAWGASLFNGPHGIHIGPDNALYLTDYLDHTVRKFTPDGRLLLTLGQSGCPAETGATTVDYRTVCRAGPPFCFPTNLALSPAGDLYVADGYGNACIHKFDALGRWQFSWGSPGSGPGQFHVPHGIAIDPAGIVYVADRENSRIQRFDLGGRFLDQWTDVVRPCEVLVDPQGSVLVAELGYRAGMFPGNVAPTADAPGGRLSIFSPRGELLARWGGGEHPARPEIFSPRTMFGPMAAATCT